MYPPLPRVLVGVSPLSGVLPRGCHLSTFWRAASRLPSGLTRTGGTQGPCGAGVDPWLTVTLHGLCHRPLLRRRSGSTENLDPPRGHIHGFPSSAWHRNTSCPSLTTVQNARSILRTTTGTLEQKWLRRRSWIEYIHVHSNALL